MLITTIKGIAWATIVTCTLAGIISLSDSFLSTIIFIFSGMVSGSLLLAVAAGLEHLETIAYHTSFLQKTTEKRERIPQTSYPSMGKTNTKSSLESLSKTYTFRSNDD